jgi:hypothetical protein
MAAIAALPLIASACSPTDPRPDPVVVTKFVRPTLPPEVRRETPALSPKPANPRDLTQDETLINWSNDRVARNIGEYRRRACVAAVDAGEVTP